MGLGESVLNSYTVTILPELHFIVFVFSQHLKILWFLILSPNSELILVLFSLLGMLVYFNYFLKLVLIISEILLTISLHRCMLRVLDSFGTEPEFNHAHYAQSKGHKTPWGKWNLNPQQFNTMFRKCFSWFLYGSGSPIFSALYHLRKNWALWVPPTLEYSSRGLHYT